MDAHVKTFRNAKIEAYFCSQLLATFYFADVDKPVIPAIGRDEDELLVMRDAEISRTS